MSDAVKLAELNEGADVSWLKWLREADLEGLPEPLPWVPLVVVRDATEKLVEAVVPLGVFAHRVSFPWLRSGT